MKKSRIVPVPAAVESPRHLPLVDLLVDARTELFELAVRSGLKVLTTMLEEDRTAICGPRYAHVAERRASRAGTVSSEVVLGGRKVAVRRPRVRADGQEVPLPTFQAMAEVDPLNRRVVEQMLVGVATRRYARSLEPVPATMRSRGTSKSAVSRRSEFIERGISGSKDRRPHLDAMMKDVKRRRFDAVVCWKLDRLGRDMRHLINLLDELRALDVGLVTLGEGLDTTTPAGRMAFGIFASVAEFERERLRERTLLGLERARAQGKRLGRPLDETLRARIAECAGMSVREAAKRVGCSTATIQKVRKLAA